MNAPKKVKAKLTEKRTQETVERTIEMPIIEGYVDVKLPDRGRFGIDFVTIFKQALQAIVQYANLSKHEYRLLLWLISTTGPNNMIITDLTLLSQQLQMDKSNLHKALKGLITRQIVIKRGEIRNHRKATDMALELNYDQLNYNLAYNGRIKEYAQHKVEHPQLTHPDGTPLIETKTTKQILDERSSIEVVDTETGEVITTTKGEWSQPPIPFDDLD